MLLFIFYFYFQHFLSVLAFSISIRLYVKNKQRYYLLNALKQYRMFVGLLRPHPVVFTRLMVVLFEIRLVYNEKV